MTGGGLQLALRDLRAHLAQQSTVAGLLAIAGVLGLSGPFETLTAMRLPERLLYWGLVTGLTYPAGFLIGHLGREWWEHWPMTLRVAVRGALVCLAVVLIVIGLAALFGRLTAQVDPGTVAWSVAMIFCICLVIDVLGDVLDRQPGSRVPPAPTMPTTDPAILSRLPFDRRGALVAIRGEDHYVHVTTIKGRQMVLMRMGDAIAETAPVAGLRVHRSHWVALDQVRAVRRQGDGAVLTLSDGSDVPASRSAMPALRQAGLL